jgi:hypothetical protein
MRIHQVLTTPIVAEDKDLIIERMDHERHLAASTLGCAELHITSVMLAVATLAEKRQHDPELNSALVEIDKACKDALAVFEFDEIELDGAMDPDGTNAFLEVVRNGSARASRYLP